MDNTEDKKVLDSAANGTPELTIETSSPDTEVNEDLEGGESLEASTETPVVEENAKKQTTRNLDAEAGKIAALQKQLNQLESLRGEVSSYFQKDPEGYKGFRKYMKESRNVDLGEYESIYGGTDTKTTETLKPTNQLPSLESVKQVVRQELRNEIEADQGFKEFITEFPEMDPAKMDATKKQEIGPMVRQIEAIASSLKSQNPDMTLGQAYSTAYRAVNPSVVAERAREEGEISGKLKELGRSSASTSAPASSAPSSSTEDTSFLTPSQRERYLEIKKTPGKESIASLYLDSAKKRKGM